MLMLKKKYATNDGAFFKYSYTDVSSDCEDNLVENHYDFEVSVSLEPGEDTLDWEYLKIELANSEPNKVIRLMVEKGTDIKFDNQGVFESPWFGFLGCKAKVIIGVPDFLSYDDEIRKNIQKTTSKMQKTFIDGKMWTL